MNKLSTLLAHATKSSLISINQKLVPVDKLFTNKSRLAVDPLFIVGSPRSGTTLAYQVITEYLKSGYFTGVMNYLYGAPNLTTYLLRPFIKQPNTRFTSKYGKIPGTLSPSEDANFWFRWFPKEGATGGRIDPNDLLLPFYSDMAEAIYSISKILKKPMIFKCVYLTMVVGALAQIFPQARFVFIRRNRFYNCQSLFLARQSRLDSDWWSVRIPNYQNLLSRPLWYQVVEQIVSTENIVSNDLRKFAPGRYMEWQYEELCKNPITLVSQLAEWLKPMGFQPYDETQIPNKFTISQKVILPDDVAAQIRDRLDLLVGDNPQ